MSAPTSPGTARTRTRRRAAGALLAVGVLLVACAFSLPAWRSVYPSGTDHTPGTSLLIPVLPLAGLSTVFAVLSLVNSGRHRWAWRQASLGMLVSNVLACGSLTGVFWLFLADEPYADETLLSTGPGAGTLLALVGCLLIPLAGSLPDNRQPATQLGGDHLRGDQLEGDQV
ncbi:hypothetical protein AB0C50_07515 [Micromonospora taraxaci]|uniref:Uncharacterized protein n=1 Tax=Micromonospora taraxaci TaxID=1316803 RepID=A0A561W7M5_9ACTN|nr:hypothetical protein [Micromonospora taraxaci]TWG19850.1 hypothetical protein FHU34_115243 [Micromonospora taraxaci]